jgi:hypothetical protein
VGLDPQADLCQRLGLRVGEHAPRRLLRRQRHPLLVALRVAHELELLAAHAGGAERGTPPGEHVGVDLDLPAHDDLAEPERTLDHEGVAVTGGGVRREHHPRARRVDHALHDHGDRRLLAHTLRVAIGEHPRAVRRHPTIHQALQQLRLPDHVGVCLVHAGERGRAGVLAGRRRAHRHRRVRTQPRIGLDDRRAHLVRHARPANKRAHRLCGLGQRRRLRHVGRREALLQLVAHATGVEGSEERRRGDDESRRYGDPCAGHLSEVGPLAPGDGATRTIQVGEPGGVIRHVRSLEQGACHRRSGARARVPVARHASIASRRRSCARPGPAMRRGRAHIARRSRRNAHALNPTPATPSRINGSSLRSRKLAPMSTVPIAYGSSASATTRM